jgi:hypothetical protein
MSKDSHIYLNVETFPREEWGEVISSFNVEKRGEQEWVFDSLDGPVRAEYKYLSENYNYSDVYQWCISFHYQSKYGPHKLWLAYAIPYHCLVLMEGAVYLGPHQSGFIHSIEEYEDFANNDILKYTSLQKLHKNGLLTQNERLKFNT